MGGPHKSHFRTVGFVLLWVRHDLGAAESGRRRRDLISILIYLGNLCRWLAWACDAIDFFSVSLNVVNLQDQFGRSTHDIVSRTPNL